MILNDLFPCSDSPPASADLQNHQEYLPRVHFNFCEGLALVSLASGPTESLSARLPAGLMAAHVLSLNYTLT